MTLYENEETLKKEEAIRKELETLLQIRYEKLPIQYSLDWAAVGDGDYIDHWAEVKCRDFPHDQYDDFVLSFEKIMMASNLHRLTGLACYLYLGFTDSVILQLRLDTIDDWTPKWGGRTKKTRRKADIHPVVLLPSEWFTRVK